MVWSVWWIELNAPGTREETTDMFRTIFSVGILAILGLFALKFVFGIFGWLVALLLWLFFIALKIALVGAVIYLIIRVVSPDTARRLREKFNG
jgi:predicted membrane metal-binding protein